MSYHIGVILTKNTPFTKEEIEKLEKTFSNRYIKTVIDIDRKICSAGCDRHFDSEQLLLREGSKQSDLWGGGIDPETLTIDCNSMINIRPRDNNNSNEIKNPEILAKFEELTKYFFEKLWKQIN